MKKILIIGSTVADIVIKLDKLPKTTEDINIDSQHMALGGCAYNVSDMVRHFGVPYILFSPIGTGIYGDFIRQGLARFGLSSPIPTPDIPNGCCYCFVEANGERTFVCDHGGEYLFRPEWFDALDMTDISMIYICGLEIEDKTGSVIIDFLEAHKEIPIFFAPGSRISYIQNDRFDRICALHPIVHLNHKELEEITGIDDLSAGAKAMYDICGNTVIITCGSQGACYYNGHLLHRIPAAKAEAIVDTIGAGDGHAGAVLASIACGLSLDEAIKKANAASALIIAGSGATVSDESFAL